jgi:hypothetical protein
MKNHGDGGVLTADHIAAIHMYTQACDFYRTLNACLRARDRTRITPFFSYLRLLLEALRLLPVQKRTVYRGVKLDLNDGRSPAGLRGVLCRDHVGRLRHGTKFDDA